MSAPCKVNLTLDVAPPRHDGYHDLDSVVATFRPADEIVVAVRPGPRRVGLTCDDVSLPSGAGNLAYRAADTFLDTFLPGEEVAVTLTLFKHLPAQAGLGGGSSDAAGVLRALDSLLPGTAAPDALRALAAAIGSDVPLFLAGASTGIRMQGRGERTAPLDTPLPPLHGVLVKPEVGVPTPAAYGLLDALPRRAPGSATERLITTLRRGDAMEAIGAALGNDFEAAILPAFPAVAAAHREIEGAGAVRALLCGSGSAVFGLARDRHHAQSLAAVLVGRFPWVNLAETAAADA